MANINTNTIFVELLKDVLYFPFWWYGRGLILIGRRAWSFVVYENRIWGPGVWLRHLFVPMFGLHDWQGRLISLFMRVFQVLFRSFLMLVYIIIAFLLLASWLLWPLLVFMGLIRQFSF